MLRELTGEDWLGFPEITHVFGKLGTRIVIQTGVCGALGDDIRPGDLVVASSAGCGEGGVACYLPGRTSVEASAELVELVLSSHDGLIPMHVGPLWTTAALLAEGESEIAVWHHDGYLAVDMETALTFGVAEWTGMRRVSVLSVFDNPRTGGHIALSETDKADARMAGDQAALRVVMRLAQVEAT